MDHPKLSIDKSQSGRVDNNASRAQASVAEVRMKKCIFLVVFASIALSAFGFDFRQTSWNMSLQEVIASEVGLQYSIDSSNADPRRTAIQYHVVVNGFRGWLTYHFYNDKLVMATYQFLDSSDFLAYHSVRTSIEQKYGKPTSSSARGGMWQTDRTVLICEFQRSSDPESKGDICLVYYFDRKYWISLGKKQQQEDSSNF